METKKKIIEINAFEGQEKLYEEMDNFDSFKEVETKEEEKNEQKSI